MGPQTPDLAGLPAPDHIPTQHPELPPERGTGGSAQHNSTIKAPEVWTAVWKGDEHSATNVQKPSRTWMLGVDYWKNGVRSTASAPAPQRASRADRRRQARRTSRSRVAASRCNIGHTAGWPTSENANTIISIVTDPSTS